LAPAAIDPQADDLDLGGSPRVVDLPGIGGALTPRDAGAYELQQLPPPASCQAAGTIFCNGFEAR
jgi:hypothetical protein